MADEEKPAGDEHKLVFGVIGFIVIAMLLMSFLGNFAFFNNPSAGGFSVTSLVPQGNLAVGTRIANEKAVEIRQQPGGALIGTQEKRETGILTEGPIMQFGKTWWRVDYPEAPDGWVTNENITSNIFLVRLVNIGPIMYEYVIRPVGIALTIITFIVFLVLKSLMNGAAAHEAKLQAIRRERALVYFKPEIAAAEQAVDDAGEVPVNLPTGNPDAVPEVFVDKNSSAKNPRWEAVLKLLNSHNENDWKQAIMEADAILDAMVERMGYEGESLGDRLGKIEASDFVTLESAWEAHRVRNKIAHGGVQFKLTKNEAERVINLYKKVFQEFYFI